MIAHGPGMEGLAAYMGHIGPDILLPHREADCWSATWLPTKSTSVEPARNRPTLTKCSLEKWPWDEYWCPCRYTLFCLLHRWLHPCLLRLPVCTSFHCRWPWVSVHSTVQPLHSLPLIYQPMSYRVPRLNELIMDGLLWPGDGQELLPRTDKMLQ